MADLPQPGDHPSKVALPDRISSTIASYPTSDHRQGGEDDALVSAIRP